jgi:hypothetical protein
MMIEEFAATRPDEMPRLSPTDISQFIRLEQCERYLRLRLHEHGVNGNFLRQYGVAPVSVTPLLTRSGAAFEERVTAAIRARYATRDFAAEHGESGARPENNGAVIAEAHALAPGGVRVLLQPRLTAALAGWQIRGDVDILRLERDATGALHILIADMKSSTSAKVEHRLQVAFYAEMLDTLLAEAGLSHDAIRIAVLYRGPAEGGEVPGDAAAQADAARETFGDVGLLEIIGDADDYRRAVHALVTDPHSTARRIIETPFDDVPFALGSKCDGCLYNEFCLKRSVERDDLSLLPHLTPNEKSALQSAAITTTRDLATLKEPAGAETPAHLSELVAAPGREETAKRLAATWPVGPRLDELIHRARAYRRAQGDPIAALSYIPSKGYGSLPYSDAAQNPNLIRIYIDAQHDYLQDRIYLLGALIVASERGVEVPHRRRTIVHMTDGPPDTTAKERALFLRWIDETLRALIAVAAPDADGAPRAPIHLIFNDRSAQQLLLDGLARHLGAIFGATPCYDFITQLAAFDSPVATHLDQEIRELKNYPMLCQSLQAVASITKFDWNAGTPFRDLFYTRLFDARGRREPDDETSRWYTRRARFNSRIPLEYAYAAWGEIDALRPGTRDQFAPYRAVSAPLIRHFQARRLEAMEHIARQFTGNKQTEKRPFDLPEIATFAEKARSRAHAIDEFVMIERHVALGAWKAARLSPPERRLLMGETLLARYNASAQSPGVAAVNATNLTQIAMAERYAADYLLANPDAERAELTKEQKKETKWDQKGVQFRLDLTADGLDCTLDEALALTRLCTGDVVVISPRLTVDARLPEAERKPFTPTPKQMLYGTRATIVEINANERTVTIEMRGAGGRSSVPGFAFSGFERPLRDGEQYTLDPDPNDWYGSFCAGIVKDLCAGDPNTLYDRLDAPASAHVPWPAAAAEAQARFLAGLDALHATGAFHDFEAGKRRFIGACGDVPTLLVQGPPGTGKSYSTAFALFARVQGAMAADRPYRAFASCKTHAATDVLLADIARVRGMLRRFAERQPGIFADYFDARLLDLPLFRASPRGTTPEGVVPLPPESERPKGAPRAADAVMAERWCIVAATPGGIYRIVKDRWGKEMLGHGGCDCLVLDEASQMNLPEAIMAALLLNPDGHLIVVGDHRQMPPIVKHDWEREPRRTFKEYRTYESLFLTLLPLADEMIKFTESFRLHADMAAFLGEEIYQQDGIPFFSANRDLLPTNPHWDDPAGFVPRVLAPDYPMVVIVHDESESQFRNRFEQRLVTPILEALAAPPYALTPADGLGVVVPHRAQRGALREDLPCLSERDPRTGEITVSAVDTVERFQGGERTAILVSATESDRAYLLTSSEFLLDPRRLTVALSRARRKMILVASESVFNLFSADEETFAHAQLWKHLLDRTCTVPLWSGTMHDKQVRVFGNLSTTGDSPSRHQEHQGEK